MTGSSWTAPGGCGCGAASSWRSANPRSIGALCWSDCVSMPLIPITASGRSWRVGCGVLVRLPVGCPVDRGIVASRRCSLMTSGAHDCSRRCIAAVVSCACPLDRFTASLAICSSVEIAKRRRRSLVSADKPNASIVRPLIPYGEAMEPVDCFAVRASSRHPPFHADENHRSEPKGVSALPVERRCSAVLPRLSA